MRIEALQVARTVLLEVIAVDDDGRLGLALPAFHLFRFVGGVLVGDDDDQALSVRRPGVVIDAALDLGQALRLATPPVEQPDLGPELLLLFRAAGGKEGQEAAVRAPAGGRLAVRARGQPDLFGPVPADHPEVGVALVLFEVRRPDRVGDPFAVGRALGIPDALDLEEVVEGDGPLGRLPGCDGDEDQGRQDASHEDETVSDRRFDVEG
jgi:hypothetical protein